MERGISSNTRRELIQAIAKRYRQAGRTEKGRILDEFVQLKNYHRKHAVRLLNQRRPSVQSQFAPFVGSTMKLYARLSL